MVAETGGMSREDRFELGEVVATLAAMEAVEEAGHDLEQVLKRHATGDWGDVTEFDRIQNEEALELGGRLLSVYKLGHDIELWVVTDENRGKTILRLSDESHV